MRRAGSRLSVEVEAEVEVEARLAGATCRIYAESARVLAAAVCESVRNFRVRGRVPRVTCCASARSAVPPHVGGLAAIADDASNSADSDSAGAGSGRASLPPAWVARTPRSPWQMRR